MAAIKTSFASLLLAAAAVGGAVALGQEPATPAAPVAPVLQNAVQPPAKEEPSASAQQFMRHDSLDADYSVELPVDWDIKANIKGFDCVAFAPKPTPYVSDYLDSLSISFYKGGKGLDDFADELASSLKAHSPDFKLLAKGKGLEIQGCKTLRLEYEFSSGRVDVRSSAILISKDGKVWSLTLNSGKRSFPLRKGIFDRALSSFKPQ